MDFPIHMGNPNGRTNRVSNHKYPLYPAYIRISHDGVRWDRGTSNYPLKYHHWDANPVDFLPPSDFNHPNIAKWGARRHDSSGKFPTWPWCIGTAQLPRVPWIASTDKCGNPLNKTPYEGLGVWGFFGWLRCSLSWNPVILGIVLEYLHSCLLN